ncbi:MAG TPA: ribosome biogenesis GTP-binding protein YihA/YsxC [Blastocatellia bacterium]|jgi:GTP-binding protein|nr:ribosome biogenesis GTP-binding protein YihA/YsxC [Blastocatellia bacterium]
MKIKSVEFVKSATAPEHYPRDGRPEIAFMGRSNVGKSSLINSLLGVRGLARTSNTPGRTQLINFFLVNEAFRFVDLPGYGYARVPLEIKNQWGPMIVKYLAGRRNLVLSVLITDSRHAPTDLDLQMSEWLSANEKPFIIVATKADKLSSNKLRANLSHASRVLGKSDLIPYSAVTRTGADRIWKQITARISDHGLPVSGQRAT